ncbi:MAG: hypothetical protein IKT24_03645 [Clostridia bacterium]|nr:hypothetical protein [Clostridia bacterium]
MKKYNCPNCSAELYWDAKANALRCEYCEKEYQPAELDALLKKSDQLKGKKEEKPTEDRSEKISRETTDQDKVSDDSSKTDNADLVVYACQNCGAEVITSKSTVATTCAFCGRAISLTNKLVGDFKPDEVIPFAVDEKKAKDIYKTYAKKGGLTPNAFTKTGVIKKCKGVYVPFWLHSYDETADVVLSCENVKSHKSGDDKIVEHEMYTVNMEVGSRFSSIPTDGLKNLSDELMAQIEPFDYSKLVEFNPAYMAGFYAEEYDENAEQKIGEAKERSKSAVSAQAIDQAGPYMDKSITSYTPTYTNVVSKYAMLPVWMFNVDYKGKLWQFAVNGETGKIAGKLPISKLKVAAAAGGGFLGTQLIAMVIRLLTM